MCRLSSLSSALLLRRHAALLLTGVFRFWQAQAGVPLAFSPSVSSDSVMLHVRIPYTGAPSFIRVFLDTGHDAGTGYQFRGIRANYLIENNRLYRYDGTGEEGARSLWTWTFLKTVTYGASHSVASMGIARADIGAPTRVSLVAETDPPKQDSGKISHLFSVVPPQISVDSTQILVKIPHIGTASSVRLFLDTDRKADTGYFSNGTGADYMVENDKLYKYNGNRDEWNWRFVGNVMYNVADGVASVNVARVDLGTPAGLDLVTETDPPKQISAKISQRFSTGGPQVSSDHGNVLVKMPLGGKPSFTRLFIDTDRNSLTGYKIGEIGANFLVENDRLYRYDGTGSNWKWVFVKSVYFAVAKGMATSEVAHTDLGSPAAVNLVTETDPPKQTSGKLTQSLSDASMRSPGLTQRAR